MFPYRGKVLSKGDENVITTIHRRYRYDASYELLFYNHFFGCSVIFLDDVETVTECWLLVSV